MRQPNIWQTQSITVAAYRGTLEYLAYELADLVFGGMDKQMTFDKADDYVLVMYGHDEVEEWLLVLQRKVSENKSEKRSEKNESP